MKQPPRPKASSAKRPPISEAEWDVMHVLWSVEQATALEVVEALSERRSWSDRTVKTLLARLVKKRVVGYRSAGKRYQYRALVTRDECVERESSSFVERVLGGSVSPLIATFVRSGKLSKKEIRELRELLDREEESR